LVLVKYLICDNVGVAAVRVVVVAVVVAAAVVVVRSRHVGVFLLRTTG